MTNMVGENKLFNGYLFYRLCRESREYVIFVCRLFALFCPSALPWPMIATQATNKLCGAE